MDDFLTSKVLIEKLPVYNRNTVVQKLEKMVESLGGFSHFVKPGMKVLIKPDLRSSDEPEYSLPTSSYLILAVTSLINKEGGEVYIADSPYLDNGTVSDIWEKCSLSEVAKAKDVEYTLVNLEKESSKSVAVDTEVYYVSEPFINADIVINLPRLKVDSLSGYAGGIRNMLGVLPGYHKAKIFSEFNNPAKASRHLVDLFSIVGPHLTIVESVYNGSNMECEDKCSYLIMSTDTVAVDNVLSESLGIPNEYDYTTRIASEAGLGLGWSENIMTIGEQLPKQSSLSRKSISSKVINGFIKTALNYNKPYIWMKPKLEASRCDGCAECSISCPTKAMKFNIDNNLPDFNYNICISCWFCKENCPNEAVYIESSKIMNKNMAFFRNNCAG